MVLSVKKRAVALGYYSNQRYKDLSLRVKNGDKEAIAEVAKELSSFTSKKMVLVPIPGHKGETTYTWDIAMAIAKISGASVVDAIAGFERKSSYECKKEGKTKNKEVWFYQQEPLPNNKIVMFIDNVVATGQTAEMARKAIGNRGGILAISISTRTGSKSHKS